MIYGNIIITIWNHDAVRITISSSVRLDLWTCLYRFMEPRVFENSNLV